MVLCYPQLGAESDWRTANTASIKETADTLGIIPQLVGLWSSVDIDPLSRHAVYTASDFLADIWLVDGRAR